MRYDVVKFYGLVISIALALGASGQLKEATLYMMNAASGAQSHQMSYAKFSRMLTHCNFGTPEYGTQACGLRQVNFARLPHDQVLMDRKARSS